MSALKRRGYRRYLTLAALAATTAVAVPALAVDSSSPSDPPPATEDTKKAEPGFRVHKQVFNPATGAYVDGDADAYSRGDNDGVIPVLSVGDTAEYKVWVWNTGDVNLYKFRVLDAACGLDETISELPVGEYVRFTCSIGPVDLSHNGFCNTAMTANPSAYDADGKEYTVEDAQSERACIAVQAPSSPDPDPAPNPTVTPVPTPAPAPVATEDPAPTVVVTPAKKARLAIRKTGRKAVRAGKITPWTIRVRSTGNTTARKVILRDRIPSGFSMVRAKIRVATKRNGKMVNVWRPVKATVKGGTVRVTLGAIKAGKAKNVRVWMRANKNARGSRVNVATADGSNTRPVRGKAPIKITPGVKTQIAPAVTG